MIGYKGLHGEVKSKPMPELPYIWKDSSLSSTAAHTGIFQNGGLETYVPQKYLWLYANYKDNAEQGNGEMKRELSERMGIPSGWTGGTNFSVSMSFNADYDNLLGAHDSRFFGVLIGGGSNLYQEIPNLKIGEKQEISFWVSSRIGFSDGMHFSILIDDKEIYKSNHAPPEKRFEKIEMSFIPEKHSVTLMIQKLCNRHPVELCYLYIDEFSPLRFEHQETLRDYATDHPAAFSTAVPISGVNLHAPNRWYNSPILKMLYSDQFRPGRIANPSAVRCERGDGTRYWNMGSVCFTAADSFVAVPWEGEDGAKALSKIAMSWSESTNDPMESRKNFLTHNCNLATIHGLQIITVEEANPLV